MSTSGNNHYESPCLKTNFGSIPVYTFQMKVKDIVFISYVAIRGVDDEEGAVQRVLSKRRISEISNFILEGNMFFNTFILNWTEKELIPTYTNGSISVPISHASAQMIDGQHRLAGLQDAMDKDPNIGDREILVSLCINLTTSQAATIFLNINSKQVQVPRSLIYDLFGEGEAYILLDGNKIEGKWKKADRISRTKYFDLEDKEVKFNRGRTWIAVLPSGSKWNF